MTCLIAAPSMSTFIPMAGLFCGLHPLSPKSEEILLSKSAVFGVHRVAVGHQLLSLERQCHTPLVSSYHVA